MVGMKGKKGSSTEKEEGCRMIDVRAGTSPYVIIPAKGRKKNVVREACGSNTKLG